MVLGVVAIAVMIWAPRGIWGVLVERFHWRIFPIARTLVEPRAPSA
jgi:branched-chain amino acid transport system permease protein